MGKSTNWYFLEFLSRPILTLKHDNTGKNRETGFSTILTYPFRRLFHRRWRNWSVQSFFAISFRWIMTFLLWTFVLNFFSLIWRIFVSTGKGCHIRRATSITNQTLFHPLFFAAYREEIERNDWTTTEFYHEIIQVNKKIVFL